MVLNARCFKITRLAVYCIICEYVSFKAITKPSLNNLWKLKPLAFQKLFLIFELSKKWENSRS